MATEAKFWTWKLLSRLVVLMPRVEDPDLLDWDQTRNSLASLSVSRDAAGARGLLDSLETLAGEYAPKAAEVDLDTLRQQVRSHLDVGRGRYASGIREFPAEGRSFPAPGNDGRPDPELDHLLTRRDLSRLREILGELAVSPRPDQVVEIFQASSEFLGVVPPSGDVSLFGYAAQLEQAWTRHRQLPPLLAFLEFLAARSVSPDAKNLRDFVRHIARQMNLEETLHTVAEAAVASRDAALAPVRVVVSAEQDEARSGNYTLTACLHLSTTGLPVKTQTASPCTLSELQYHGELLLDQAGAWLADIDSGSLMDLGKLRAEFELPMALIDQPVDKWRVGVGSGIDIELGVRCIVLVRPSDYHRGWGFASDKRWAQMRSGTGQSRVQWLHRTRAFRADLNSEDIRLAELAGIRYHPDDPDRSDVDLQRREIYVRGKGARTGSCGSIMRRPAGSTGYLRVRAVHLQSHRSRLWLGTGERGPLTRDGIYQMVKRRGGQVSLT